MIGILAGLKALVDILKTAGVIRDRRQEADIQTQFLTTTSGPLYALARIGIIYFSAWDIFRNQAQAWKAAGLPPVMEALILFWLFLGPAIVPFAEAALRAYTSKGNLLPQQPIRPTKPPDDPPANDSLPQDKRTTAQQDERTDPQTDPNLASERDRVTEGLRWLDDAVARRDE